MGSSYTGPILGMWGGGGGETDLGSSYKALYWGCAGKARFTWEVLTQCEGSRDLPGKFLPGPILGLWGGGETYLGSSHTGPLWGWPVWCPQSSGSVLSVCLPSAPATVGFLAGST